MPDPSTEPGLSSGVIVPPGEIPLGKAIAEVLLAAPSERASLFTLRTAEIQDHVCHHHPQQPWTCRLYRGTDGSHVFRGGVGHSLVIDPEGRLWRARSYEDFETTYDLSDNCCEIATLTPLYHQMRQYLPL